MKFKDDYALAGVPMLPVVATAAVARKILFYSYVMVGVTLALTPYAGWIYGACAGGLGAGSSSRLIGSVPVLLPGKRRLRCGCSTCPSPISPCCSQSQP